MEFNQKVPYTVRGSNKGYFLRINNATSIGEEKLDISPPRGLGVKLPAIRYMYLPPCSFTKNHQWGRLHAILPAEYIYNRDFNFLICMYCS